jgi:YVTN family beta-propeller protein
VTPADLVITRDGKTAYVALDHAGQVAAIDVQARRVRDYIAIGGRASGLAMANDERKLYVADRFGDAITIVDLRRNGVIASIPIGRRASGLAVDDGPKTTSGLANPLKDGPRGFSGDIAVREKIWRLHKYWAAARH